MWSHHSNYTYRVLITKGYFTWFHWWKLWFKKLGQVGRKIYVCILYIWYMFIYILYIYTHIKYIYLYSYYQEFLFKIELLKNSLRIEGRHWACGLDGDSKKTDLHKEWTCILSGRSLRKRRKENGESSQTTWQYFIGIWKIEAKDSQWVTPNSTTAKGF